MFASSWNAAPNLLTCKPVTTPHSQSPLWRDKNKEVRGTKPPLSILVRAPLLAGPVPAHAVLTLRTTTTAKTGQRRRRSQRRQRRQGRFKLVLQSGTPVHDHPLAHMSLSFFSSSSEPSAEVRSGKPARMSTALAALAGLLTFALNPLEPLSILDSIFASFIQVSFDSQDYRYSTQHPS